MGTLLLCGHVVEAIRKSALFFLNTVSYHYIPVLRPNSMLECCHVIVFTSHCLHTLLLCEFSVGGCVPEWEGDTQCGRVCPRVRECSPVWEGVPQYGRVFPSVGGCSSVWEGVSQCGRVCPSLGGCVLGWEDVHQ